jgi:hypothetical protein
MRPLWLALLPGLLMAQFHRAEQDLEIHYWLLEPDSHQFRISHDFTISRSGQKYVHSFVRKGSVVTKSVVIDLNTGKELETSNVTGKAVNALGYYPTAADPESVVVQGNLDHALAAGESVRVRVIETYTDPVGYRVDDGELVWDRTLGRPYDDVALPAGWMLTSVNVPAIVSMDTEGRVVCRFTNPRNDEIHVVLKGRKRKSDQAADERR